MPHLRHPARYAACIAAAVLAVSGCADGSNPAYEGLRSIQDCVKASGEVAVSAAAVLFSWNPVESNSVADGLRTSANGTKRYSAEGFPEAAPANISRYVTGDQWSAWRSADETVEVAQVTATDSELSRNWNPDKEGCPGDEGSKVTVDVVQTINRESSVRPYRRITTTFRLTSRDGHPVVQSIADIVPIALK